jgi:5S rRNA maturation endonuclease (ribonuclease M5)
LQIFSTTHSDLMMQYADSVAIANKNNNITQLSLFFEKKEILKLCASCGISRYVDPILQYPLEPVIIVEGKFDYDYIMNALKVIKPIIPFRLTFLEELVGGGKTGGVDDILNYIKNYKNHIKLRQKYAPVIIVLDWEAAKKVKEFEKHFKVDDPFKVFVWPESDCNPSLDKSIKGIERFYSDRIIKAAESQGAILPTFIEGGVQKKTIRNEDREKFKKISNTIVNEGLKKDDIIFSRKFIECIFKFLRTCN